MTGFVAAAAAQEAPDAMIKRAVDEVTTAIKADRDIRGGNRHKINLLVDSKIVPCREFPAHDAGGDRASLARATPEQQQALIKEFKVLLTNTYAGASAVTVPTTVIEYRPFRMQAGDS